MTLSLYIHYPFCLSKCPYCDFNSYRIKNIDEELFLKCYLKELDSYYNITKNRKIDTIFFGGGTPSIMSINFLSKIMEKIDSCWGIDNIEISMEANPTTVEIEKFKDFKNIGINRLSIGIQSLNDKELRFFGRIHNREEAIKSIETAQKLFNNYSIDLIYARPEQKIDDWLKELKEAITLSPYHISLYQLIIEEGTVFYKKNIKTLEESKSAEMYNITKDFLNDNNINMYEVSNYSKKGYECRHNINYWKSQEWIGIGAGAHGRLCSNLYIKDYKERYEIKNYNSVDKWQEAVLNNGFGYEEKNKLTRQEFIEELLLMGLRMKNGINTDDFKEYLNVEKIENVLNKNYVNYLKYINLNNNSLSVKEKYFNVLDSVVLRLI